MHGLETIIARNKAAVRKCQDCGVYHTDAKPVVDCVISPGWARARKVLCTNCRGNYAQAGLTVEVVKHDAAAA